MLEIPYETQIIFYQNPRGGYAVSVDGGDTVVLPSGKRIDLVGSVWTETEDEDLAEKNLSPEQRTALGEIRAKKNATGIDAILLRTRESKRSLRGYYAKPEAPQLVVPEGALVVKSDFED